MHKSDISEHCHENIRKILNRHCRDPISVSKQEGKDKNETVKIRIYARQHKAPGANMGFVRFCTGHDLREDLQGKTAKNKGDNNDEGDRKPCHR